VVGLQSGNEYSWSDIIAIVIDQHHLTLKITDVALQSFSLLHLDHKEMVVVLLKLLSRGILVEEGAADLLKAPE